MGNVIEEGTIQTGTVYVKEGCIFYEPLHGQVIKIALDEIGLIGEYTINNNPLHMGEWQVVFVKKNGSWESMPSLTENMPQLLEYLACSFKIDFNPYDLTTTIRAKSIIRYPAVLKNSPLFIITPPQNFAPPVTFLQKMKALLQSVNGKKGWRFELTPAVKAFLEER